MNIADKIRQMNDEELAAFLADNEQFSPCQMCDYLFKDAMNESCNAPSSFVCVKEYAAAMLHIWLQSEGDKSVPEPTPAQIQASERFKEMRQKAIDEIEELARQTDIPIYEGDVEVDYYVRLLDVLKILEQDGK